MKQVVADKELNRSHGKKSRLSGRAGLLIWLLSLAVLTLSAVPFTQPGYMDAYYYHHVASNIAAGRGFVEDYIWNYLPPPDAVSHPSNLYWLPMTSLAMVPFFRFLGDSFRVAQVPFVLLASLLVLLTYWLAIRLSGNLRHAVAASALTLFSGFYFAYWSAQDSFALFGLSVNAVLLLSAGFLIARDAPFAYRLGIAALAGGLAAVSHLTRADGVLALFVALAMIAIGGWRTWDPHPSPLPEGEGIPLLPRVPSGRGRRGRGMRVPWVRVPLTIAVCLAAYLLVMSPWFLRNWVVAGSLLPMAGMKTIFLQEYNDFFSYGKDLSWQSFLSWGLLPILKSRIDALASNVLVLFGMEYHLVPFALVGLWHLRRKIVVAPFFVYAGVLYLAMSLLFPFPSGRGSMLHSSAVMLPWLSVGAVVGLDRSVVWAARRLRHWQVATAQRNFTMVLILFAVLFSVFILVQEAGKRDERYGHYGDIASWLQEAAPDSLVMIADPPGYFYVSGKSSVVIPSDDLDTVLLAAKRYGASYIVLEHVHSRPLDPYYKGEKADARLQRVAEIDSTQIFRIEQR